MSIIRRSFFSIVFAATITSNIAQPTPDATYLGCYVDCNNIDGGCNAGNRVMPVFYFDSDASYQKCFQLARQHGYRYAGLEDWQGNWNVQAGQCFAGNDLQLAQSQGIVDPSTCGWNCCRTVQSSDGQIIWGGFDSVAVYDLQPGSQPTSQPTQQPTQQLRTKSPMKSSSSSLAQKSHSHHAGVGPQKIDIEARIRLRQSGKGLKPKRTDIIQ
jgi:hypothetical protein